MTRTIRLDGHEGSRLTSNAPAGENRGPEQAAATRPTSAATVDRAERSTTQSVSTGTTAAPLSATTGTWDRQTALSASTFAANVEAALQGTTGTLSSDDLYAAFLRLNVVDPNDNIKTQMQLLAAQGMLARLAVKQARSAMLTAVRNETSAAGRDLLSKSLLAADPALVKVQAFLVKKGWMSEEYVAYHIKLAKQQQERANRESGGAKETIASAQAQLDAAIDMLKEAGKRMQALLARQTEDARQSNAVETATIDGVPLAKVQPAIANAMSRIYSQLADIQDNGGSLAVLGKVADIAREELTAALTTVGIETIETLETLVEFLVAHVQMDVSAAHLEGAAAHATGVALSQLGSHYEGDQENPLQLAAADIAALGEGDARDVLDRQQAERLRS